MFGWFKRKEPRADVPPRAAVPQNARGTASGAPHPEAPASAVPQSASSDTKGQPPKGGMDCTEGRVAFANDRRNWSEEFNVLTSLSAVLQARGITTDAREKSIKLVETGLELNPRMQSLQPTNKGVQLTTTIQCGHRAFGPLGLFEYQHTNGSSIEDALRKGFDQWATVDLAVLFDSLREDPKDCMVLRMELPGGGATPARVRRAILGPVAHFCQKPPAQTEEHPFCPCCLLTNNLAAFQRLIESDDYLAIRFFAARDERGLPQADCRINGDDFDEGKAAILKYVESWPDRGVEFRKQYVIVQNVPAAKHAAWRT